MRTGIQLTWMLTVPFLTYLICLSYGIHGNNPIALLSVGFMALLAFISVRLDAWRLFALATAILIAHPLVVLLNISMGDADLRTLLVVVFMDATIIAILIFPTAFFGALLHKKNS